MITLLHEDEFSDRNIKIRDWSKDSHHHTHTFFELMYVTEGTITHSLNGAQSESIPKGSFIFIDLGNSHSFTCNDATIVNISFSAKLIDKHMTSCKDINQLMSSSKFSFNKNMRISFPAGIVMNDETGDIIQLIIMMQKQITLNSELSYNIIRQHMIALLFLIIQPHYDNLSTKTSSPLSDKVLSLVQENYAKPDVLSIAAQKLNYSVATLSLQFHKDFGITFKEYLRRYRLDEAKHFLETTNMKISEISQAIGYSDSKFFTKIFKEYTGVTPREYRRNIPTLDDIIIENL